ncbi:MAG: DHH family phosphoesterase, partial [Duodenibacillus sp.]|nr:DHH family phosphoesterase [Duodenibacillus sp.]
MNTRFCIRPYDVGACDRLLQSGMPRPLAQVLSARGILSASDLAEDWARMLPPDTLGGTAEAARILADARERGEHVMIVADYDCDGATACAVAVRGLSMMGLSVDYIVPNRFRFGYGLSPAIVDIAAAGPVKPDLIVTVDNGISSSAGVAHAAELGIRVLITDHHLAGDALPQAACIVNPNTPGNGFASKSLAGCGVMFYVLLALRAELRRRGAFTRENQPRLDALVDL